MYPQLLKNINSFEDRAKSIPDKRKLILRSLAEYIQSKIDANQKAQLVFICTHNSRRSSMGQIWAFAAAAYSGLGIESFSGGTESTSFNHRAVAAMEKAGFKIENPDGENPKYRVLYSDQGPELLCWSKVYDESYGLDCE